MAEGSETDGGRRKSRSRSVGRAIATSLVVFSLAYLILSGLVSVVPQIFWPAHTPAAASVVCTNELATLRGELFDQAGARIGAGGDADDALDAWLAAWDRRYNGVEDRCTGEDAEAWALLGQLRQRVESTLHRFDAAEGDLDRDLARALARASTPSP